MFWWGGGKALGEGAWEGSKGVGERMGARGGTRGWGKGTRGWNLYFNEVLNKTAIVTFD